LYFVAWLEASVCTPRELPVDADGASQARRKAMTGDGSVTRQGREKAARGVSWDISTGGLITVS